MLTPRVTTMTGPKLASVRVGATGWVSSVSGSRVPSRSSSASAARIVLTSTASPAFACENSGPEAVAPTTVASTAGRSKRLASAATVLSSRAPE